MKNIRIDLDKSSAECLQYAIKTSALIYGGAALVFLFIGLLCLLGLGKKTILSVNKGMMTYESIRLLGADQKVQAPVEDVLGAARELREGFGRSYVIVVKMKNGSIEFNPTDFDGDQKMQFVERFNADLAAGKPIEFMEDSGIYLGGIVFFGSLGIAIYLLAILQTIKIHLSKEHGLLIQSMRLVLPVKITRKAALSDLSKISKKEIRVRGASSYQLLFELRNGKKLKVSRAPIFTRQDAEQMCSKINRWINTAR